MQISNIMMETETLRTPHWKIKAGSHYSDSPQLGFELAKKKNLTQQCPIRMRSYDATTGNIAGTAAQLVTEDGFVPGAYVVRKKDKVTAVIQHFDKEMVILRVIGEGHCSSGRVKVHYNSFLKKDGQNTPQKQMIRLLMVSTFLGTMMTTRP